MAIVFWHHPNMARPLVFTNMIKVCCTDDDKDAAKRVAARLGCEDPSDMVRLLIRWLDTAENDVVDAVKVRL